ncbi:MAG: DUF47 family protein [Deltaproteobacteria bacterium]|nr:DUF47 family protein [Deltaproteobacteria bacterium]
MIFYKENEMIDLIVKQTEKVKECLNTIKEMVESYLQNNLKDSASLAIKAKGVKKDIEYLRDQIIDLLYRGALIPALREDIFILVNNLNSLAMAAIECGNIFLDQRPGIPSNIKMPLSKMVHRATDITEPLDNCIVGCVKGIHKKNDIRQYAQKVRKSFMNVCTVKSDLIREISSSSADQLNKIQLYQCLKNVKAISEDAVKVTENVETILIKF